MGESAERAAEPLTRASGTVGKQMSDDGADGGQKKGTVHMNDEIDLEQDYRKHVEAVLRQEAVFWEESEDGSEKCSA